MQKGRSDYTTRTTQEPITIRYTVLWNLYKQNEVSCGLHEVRTSFIFTGHERLTFVLWCSLVHKMVAA